MEIESGRMYAVITGDIVGSSRLASRERAQLHTVMKQGAGMLRERFPQAVPLDVDIFRGDSWQLLVTDPTVSLRVGLSYRVFIKVHMHRRKVDSRVSVGVGGISLLPEDSLSGADGEAFKISGEGLEDMPRQVRMRYRLAGEAGEQVSEAVDAVVGLIDFLAMNWTPKQAQAVSGALQGWTQARIAESWTDRSISQQAVAQHLDRAGWNALVGALQYVEQVTAEVVCA